MTTALSTDTRTPQVTAPAETAVPGVARTVQARPRTARSAQVRSAQARGATARALPVRRPHLVPVPECEPPFDDERPGYGPVAGSAARWSWSRSVGIPVADWTVPGWCNDADMGVSRTRSSALPDPRETAGVLARALLEALAGLRQLNQLSTHCSPEVFAGLKVRVRPGGSPPKLMSVRASEPTDGVAEASAVFRRGTRAAALAFRMQGIDGRWRVTELQIG